MITSIHTLIYPEDAVATRTFLGDVLGWKYGRRLGRGLAIFQSGRSEIGGAPDAQRPGRQDAAINSRLVPVIV